MIKFRAKIDKDYYNANDIKDIDYVVGNILKIDGLWVIQTESFDWTDGECFNSTLRANNWYFIKSETIEHSFDGKNWFKHVIESTDQSTQLEKDADNSDIHTYYAYFNESANNYSLEDRNYGQFVEFFGDLSELKYIIQAHKISPDKQYYKKVKELYNIGDRVFESSGDLVEVDNFYEVKHYYVAKSKSISSTNPDGVIDYWIFDEEQPSTQNNPIIMEFIGYITSDPINITFKNDIEDSISPGKVVCDIKSNHIHVIERIK